MLVLLFVNEYFVDNILNKPELICFHTIKWFLVMLYNSNNSLKQQPIVSTQLHGYIYDLQVNFSEVWISLVLYDCILVMLLFLYS